MQIERFIQPVEDDFILVSQGSRLAVILRSIFAGKSEQLLRSVQRVVYFLRLVKEQVRLGLQNEAGALDLSGDPTLDGPLRSFPKPFVSRSRAFMN